MKSIKLLLLLCLAVSFSQCSTVKLTETAPFKITGATYHNWVGGQPGVSGINLIIGIENKSDITIKSIYFANRKNNPSLENRNGKEYLVVNINTSPVLISVKREVVLTGGARSPRVSPPNISQPSIPFNLDRNEAVIKYVYCKKTFYYKISDIKKTDTEYYP